MAKLPALIQALRDAEERYCESNPKSLQYYREAGKSMPGGNTRSVIFYPPFPVTLEKGEGAYLWDIDGHRYTDFLGEYSAGLYGHSNPVLKEAISGSLESGVVLGGPNTYESKLARTVCERFQSCELVRFCNSGTEANLLALCTARVMTGRSHILAFDGGYHGGVLKMAADEPLNVPFPFVLGRYNDVERTRELVEQYADSLAAIIVEPMMGAGGAIPGDPVFLAWLREVATKHGIVLIFDEVMTSRLSPGGLQGKLDIAPDMTTFGKYLGGGFSFGAFGGRADIMARFDPAREDALTHAGTFNNNVMSMSAGLAGLRDVFTPEAAQILNDNGDRLRDKLNETAHRLGVPVQVTGIGSIMSLHFHDRPIHSPDGVEASPEMRALAHLEMMRRGIYFARRGYIALSLPLTEQDYEHFVSAFSDFLAEYRGLF